MASADKDEEGEKQEQPSDNVVQKDDAWTRLLIDYHKAILSAWVLTIDVGANWLKAQARMWSPDSLRALYRQTKEKGRS